MDSGFSPILHERLQAFAPLREDAGVLVQAGLPPGEFEQQYLHIRRQEGRLYSDAQVRRLPQPGGALGASHEWRVRALSSRLLVEHLRLRSGQGPILELGCGNGWLSHLLMDALQCEVCGVDVNRTELAQAARVFGHDPRLSFVAADIQTLALPPALFATIVLPACIQYFADAAALVARLLPLLHAAGELHIVDSPLYASAQQARDSAARTLRYFDGLGYPALAAHYHQHTYASFDRFVVQMRFDPRRPRARLRRWLRRPQPHFPWLCIRRQDNLDA
ncbi:class I SAM-dependent methyltransferase [Xanthomonas maliensis]|uniref:class I SAM-dependent methyltransferase n=1 Tax=Xanthomonas maliensis TaxID=1321368 RepID=UPI00039A3E67|nr:class I SAM-dependent methyltransferase [Xanthomonas maliensis]KAB7770064.1 class I SAM-dependent methyltransferase [Xanthomonas maliensis]